MKLMPRGSTRGFRPSGRRVANAVRSAAAVVARIGQQAIEDVGNRCAIGKEGKRIPRDPLRDRLGFVVRTSGSFVEGMLILFFYKV